MHSLLVLATGLVLLCGAGRVQAQAAPELRVTLVGRLVNARQPTTQNNIVRLACHREVAGSPGSFNPVPRPLFHQRNPLNSEIRDLSQFGLDEHEITFMITPDLEGGFSCSDRDGDLDRKSAEIVLVAFPLPNEMIAAQTNFTARQGGRVELPCEFEVGRFSQLYTYRWLDKDRRIIFTSRSSPMATGTTGGEPNGRFEVNVARALIISDLSQSDNGDVYFCQLTVNSPEQTGGSFTNMGSPKQLEVYDPVKILDPPESQVVRETASSTLFTCRAKGAPLPSITWLFNGTALTGTPLEVRTLGLSVSEVITGGSTLVSTLELRTAKSIHNVPITCEALNQPTTRPDLATTVRNTSSLSVLPNSVSNLILAAAPAPEVNKVFVDFALPAAIRGAVRLHVRYVDQLSPRVVPASFSDTAESTFRNTRSVHFELPESTRADLSSFRVRVALTAAEAGEPQREEFSDSSNAITVVESPPSSLTMIIIGGCVGGGILGVVVVMIVIAITCCCYIKRKRPYANISGASSFLSREVSAVSGIRGDMVDGPLPVEEGEEEVDGPWPVEEGKEDVPWQADYCWTKDCPWQGLVWTEKEKKKKMKNHEQKETENVSEEERDQSDQPRHVEPRYVELVPLRAPRETVEGNDVNNRQRDGECTENQVTCNGQQIAIDFEKDRVGYRQSYYAAANEPQYH